MMIWGGYDDLSGYDNLGYGMGTMTWIGVV